MPASYGYMSIDINTNNVTESINNAMRSQHIKIRPYASVFSLAEALVEVAFPEMEKQYIQAAVKQMESYQKSIYPIPKYLLCKVSALPIRKRPKLYN